MLRLCALVVAAATIGLVLTYAVFEPIAIEQGCKSPDVHCPDYAGMTMALTMIVAGAATLFGTLAMPGAQNPDGSFREQRIRLSIAMSVFVIYMIWWAFAVQWSSAGQDLDPMFETLTDLLKIIIPFYFGASAFAQWSEGRSGRPKGDDED